MTSADLQSTPSAGFSTPAAAMIGDETEMNMFMQNLTKDMQVKFTNILDSVLGKVEEMTNRIEELEQHVNELIVSSSKE